MPQFVALFAFEPLGLLLLLLAWGIAESLTW
jgi:hypothetical protein